MVGLVAQDNDCERRAAKANFESALAAWRSGRLTWALRGQRGTDNERNLISTILAGHVHFSDKVFTQLKSLAGFNVLDYFPMGRPGEISVTDSVDLMCDTIMGVLKFGLRADVPDDAASMLSVRATFRMQLLRHHGEFNGAASREVLADLPN